MLVLLDPPDHGEVIACPKTPQEWQAISDQFANRWNMHNCVGAIDGKHVALTCPPRGGSIFYDYKGYHSIILMALVDAEYKFSWVDVGRDGSSGDSQVFNDSELKAAIDDGTINFPQPTSLPHDDKPIPYFIVGDDAFALNTWMMKPYSKRYMSLAERIFNYRLSRARRIVENAFGILAHRFQCILGIMKQKPAVVTSIVLACVCLHNLMRMRYPHAQNVAMDNEDDQHNIIPGAWRDNNHLLPIVGQARLRGGELAKQQRDYLMAYYNSPVGAVPWQWNRV